MSSFLMRLKQGVKPSNYPGLSINLVKLSATMLESVESVPVDFASILTKAQKRPKRFPLASSIDGYGHALFAGDQFAVLLAELAKMSLNESEQKIVTVLADLKERVHTEELVVEFTSVFER